jgi:hypothetical protein
MGYLLAVCAHRIAKLDRGPPERRKKATRSVLKAPVQRLARSPANGVRPTPGLPRGANGELPCGNLRFREDDEEGRLPRQPAVRRTPGQIRAPAAGDGAHGGGGNLGSGVMGLRGNLYALARLLGDVNAVRRGTVGRRLVNTALGRTLVRRLWR